MIKNFIAQVLLKNMLTMLANQKKKVQVTVEVYLVYIGSIIPQHIKYVNHVNKEIISTF